LGQRAALYCRVSTADQSCARQERDLRAFAARAGYEVVCTVRAAWAGPARIPAYVALRKPLRPDPAPRIAALGLA